VKHRDRTLKGTTRDLVAAEIMLKSSVLLSRRSIEDRPFSTFDIHAGFELTSSQKEEYDSTKKLLPGIVNSRNAALLREICLRVPKT